MCQPSHEPESQSVFRHTLAFLSPYYLSLQQNFDKSCCVKCKLKQAPALQRHISVSRSKVGLPVDPACHSLKILYAL